MTVDHPNLITIYEVYEDLKYVHIVMDLCTGGDLFDYISQHSDSYTESEVATIISKILRGLSHIHSSGICHRDLKPENIMFEDTTEHS
jgi:calcium-dependent protein kinase